MQNKPKPKWFWAAGTSSPAAQDRNRHYNQVLKISAACRVKIGDGDTWIIFQNTAKRELHVYYSSEVRLFYSFAEKCSSNAQEHIQEKKKKKSTSDT